MDECFSRLALKLNCLGMNPYSATACYILIFGELASYRDNNENYLYSVVVKLK